jgi:hypothetical protein
MAETLQTPQSNRGQARRRADWSMDAAAALAHEPEWAPVARTKGPIELTVRVTVEHTAIVAIEPSGTNMIEGLTLSRHGAVGAGMTGTTDNK